MSTQYATNPTSFLRNINRIFGALDEKLEKSVKDHLFAVYSTLAVGLTVAGLGSALHLFTEVFRAGFLLSLGSFFLMMAVLTTPATRENDKKRLGYFFGFCLTSGISLGPLLEMAISVDPAIVTTALFSTIIVFGCFSMAALHAPSTKFLYLGGTLASATFSLLIFTIFFRWLVPFTLLMWAGLAISCVFILYDTQLIVEKNRRGDHDYIWHSVELFIDFIQVFRYVMILLTEKRDRDNRRRQD